jgi:ribonuclease Z
MARLTLGYLLTTGELMDSRTKVHGPKNLAHFLATFRHYLWRTSMDLHTNEFGESPAPYKDERVTVTPIPLSPHTPSQAPTPHDPEDPARSSFEKLIRISPSTFTGTPSQILALKEAIVHEMFKKGTYDFDMNSPALFAQLSQDMKRRSSLINAPLPPTTPSSTTMAYFVKNHGLLGKFDLEKAEALGVPRGRLYGKLKSGEDVKFEATNENGEMIVKVVKSEEVVQPAVEGHSVLVLDIPGLEYVDQVLKNDTLNADFVKGADVVVHMLGDEVATDKRYIDWMHSFKDSSLVSPLLELRGANNSILSWLLS